jgi:IS30 family transposase
MQMIEYNFRYIFPLKSKTVKEVENKMSLINTTIPIHSITFDNGREFTNHQEIAQNLD